MSMSGLYRRYDGPIPPWELPVTPSHSRSDRLHFHRTRALDAAKILLAELTLAAVTQAALRLDHWHNAARMAQRYGYERRAHSVAAVG